ncbi:MAG TPA: hypothetical protein VF665_02580 [Longimicrobium sp.]|uniref:hypothetical protein n=1 Tax=Longimicrobium sp. TaxID=2029185 RepID=UPI002EDA4CB4
MDKRQARAEARLLFYVMWGLVLMSTLLLIGQWSEIGSRERVLRLLLTAGVAASLLRAARSGRVPQ